MRELERRVLEAVDVGALVDCLGSLIAIESTGGRETPAQERMAALMEELAMDVDVWELDLDALRRDPAYCVEIERRCPLGVVGRTGAGHGPTLVLNGHVDVVPAGEPLRWATPPWRGSVREGRVYGRGSADMKGGLCCALFALRALRDAGIRLRGSVLLHSVVGEEDGGLGTLAAIRRGHTGDAAIVLEPTELHVAPAHAGAFNFRVTVPGIAAHGALRTEGVSPIEKFPPILQALQQLEHRRNSRPRHPLFTDQALPYPICIGIVRAGIWASTVPETLTLEGRLGIAVDEDPEAARCELAATLAEAAAADPWLREHPPVLEWWGGQFSPAVIPGDHPIVATLADALRAATGKTAMIHGMPYGADMHLLVNQGRTSTVLFGPGDVRRAHAPDEFVPVAELAAATRTVAVTILRFCGVESGS
ncbi:MAG: ArgE/DapE family deacylase [Longimicrobiales bacterium]